jgi:hypothetical protein
MISRINDPFSVQGKSETPTKERLFVGTHIPRQIADFISLYALYKGVYKSQIIDRAIQDYYQNLQKIKIEDMINILADRAVNEWKNYLQTGKDKEGFPHLTFETYLKKIQGSLRKRGISLSTSKKIIEKVKNETY